MIIENGIRYYNSREISDIIGVSNQTLVNWDKWSCLRVAEGDSRLIPKHVRMNGNKRFWAEDEVVMIMTFSMVKPKRFAERWTNREYVKVPSGE